MPFQRCPVKTHRGAWNRGSMERENPDFSEFALYDRSSGTRSRIDRFYIDIKIASNNKINDIMVSFSYHYNAIFIYRFPSKTKTG